MIKLFEEYNSYYSEINSDEYYSYPSLDASNLFGKINGLICDEFESKHITAPWLSENEIIWINEIEHDPGETFMISVADDDWYLVLHVYYNWSYDSNYDSNCEKVVTYYKCDQYDGLVRLLDDFDIIK